MAPWLDIASGVSGRPGVRATAAVARSSGRRSMTPASSSALREEEIADDDELQAPPGVEPRREAAAGAVVGVEPRPLSDDDARPLWRDRSATSRW